MTVGCLCINDIDRFKYSVMSHNIQNMDIINVTTREIKANYHGRNGTQHISGKFHVTCHNA